ncbi:hypothetical protein D6833_11385, partial [Candidatus Parcubacteria bacterium]
MRTFFFLLFLLSPFLSPHLLHGYQYKELTAGFLLLALAGTSAAFRFTPRMWLAFFGLLLPAAIHIFLHDARALEQLLIWTVTIGVLFILFAGARSWAWSLFEHPSYSALLLIVVQLACIHDLLQDFGFAPVYFSGWCWQIFSEVGQSPLFGGMFYQRNLFGLFLLIGLAFAWERQRRHERAHWWVLSIIPLAILMSAGGRSALLLAMMISLLFIYGSS